MTATLAEPAQELTFEDAMRNPEARAEYESFLDHLAEQGDEFERYAIERYDQELRAGL